jgi:general stress protein 26
MTSDLELLYSQIEEIEVAMMTTRRRDGHLQSRAMATQKRAAGADLWFVTAETTSAVRDIGQDAHLNLSYYKDRTREWISVSGIGSLSREKAKIEELYSEDWRMWFSDDGDPRAGTPEDPTLVLIGVEIHAATFLKLDKPQPVVLYELAKGFLTHDQPEIGEPRRIEKPLST